MNKDELKKAATDIIIKYEVDISYEEGCVNKGLYLLEVMEKLGYKIVKDDLVEGCTPENCRHGY